ncbi:MAG: AIR carboxylase family protein [Eggerthellaceae bacterium]
MSCDHKNPVVGIIMGSEATCPPWRRMKQLENSVPYEVKVASAHRKPLEVHEWAESAEERGIRVIIAAAGRRPILAVSSQPIRPLPVIAVPMKTSDLGGLDSCFPWCRCLQAFRCLRCHQRRENAAILAVQMMGTDAKALVRKSKDLKASMAQ